jgi:hypothetical protein
MQIHWLYRCSVGNKNQLSLLTGNVRCYFIAQIANFIEILYDTFCIYHLATFTFYIRNENSYIRYKNFRMSFNNFDNFL